MVWWTLSVVGSNAILEGIYMSTNPIYPLKDGYNTWKILSHECSSWGKFIIIIDNKWFDELL
jgi:hypothetical protein